MTFDRFDLFEAYTNQTLPDAERLRLDEQLRTDPNLLADLRDYQQFRHSIEAVGLKQQLEGIHTRLERQGRLRLDNRPPQELRPPQNQYRKRFGWVVAALLLGCGLAGYWFVRPSHAEQLFVAYYQPEPVARGEAACDPALQPAIDAYRRGQYSPALRLLVPLPQRDACVAYYTGLAHLALNQPQPAIAAFTVTLQSRLPATDLTRQKAEWYAVLAYLRANRPADARQQLQQLIEQPAQPFRPVAQKLLNDLGHA